MVLVHVSSLVFLKKIESCIHQNTQVVMMNLSTSFYPITCTSRLVCGAVSWLPFVIKLKELAMMKMGVVLLCRRWLLVNGDYTGGFENEMPSIVKAHIDYWYSHSGFYKISQGSLFMFIILKGILVVSLSFCLQFLFGTRYGIMTKQIFLPHEK